jgi:general secretion pathway protein F
VGAYEFVALDKSGKESKGLIEGDTPKHVRQMLRERNMFPVRVTEVAQREAKRQTTFSLRRGLSPGELALITRQMASLSQSGLPLEEVLLAVSQQNDQPRTKSILLGVRSRVMEGHTLADGLGDFPQAFPELYRATVAAGEQSGHLDVVLERLADYTEARQELRQRITNAMIYPAALIVMAISIISFRKHFGRAAGPDPRPDRHQRLPAQQLALVDHRHGCCDMGFVVAVSEGRSTATLP